MEESPRLNNKSKFKLIDPEWCSLYVKKEQFTLWVCVRANT